MTAADTGAPRVRWRWIAAFWCAGGLFEASQSIFMLHAEGKHHGELKLFLVEWAAWLPWALATPLIIGLARRYPVIRPRARGVAAHLAALAAVSVTAVAWSAALQVIFDPWVHRRPPTFWDTLGTTLVFQALNCLAAYALILTITYLVDSRDKVARQQTEAARLNEALSNAQLAALRRQMEPHFMFNALNSIAGLVRDNRNEAAVGMIVGLSEFLRRATDDSHRAQVTLAEEVEYLQRYVDIQKVRFGERLRVSVDIPSDLLEARTPGLLLQPLVENAIKHGIAKRVAGGTIRVTGVRSEGRLRLGVHDDGPGLPEDWPAKTSGVGLANLRSRLQILYGEAAELLIGPAEDGGVQVLVTLPLAEA
jgi:two-component system LytT family sensor kinase